MGGCLIVKRQLSVPTIPGDLTKALPPQPSRVFHLAITGATRCVGGVTEVFGASQPLIRCAACQRITMIRCPRAAAED